MTMAQLREKGKEKYDDERGILVLDYCRDLPTDYGGKILVPTSICFFPNLKAHF